jgi:tetratricopeptide (TPR) repeat protein
MIRGSVRSRGLFEGARVALLTANLAWTTLSLGGFLPGSRVGMSVLTAALAAVHLADPDRAPRAHPAGWLALPFLIYAAANVIWVSPTRWLGWFDWLNWTQGAVVFWVVLNGVVTPWGRRTLAGAVGALGLLSATLACYQHWGNPDWLMLGRRQAAQFVGRSSGPFGIPNSLGVFMALLIPPAGAVALDRRRPALMRAVGAGALALFVAGFVLAISRGAWLALAAAFALRALLAPGRSLGRRLTAGAAAVGAAAALAALSYLALPLMRERVAHLVRDAGERSRPAMWRAAWRIFLAHPTFGSGAGSYDSFFEAYRPMGNLDQPTYAHDDYLNTLSDYGAVGFVLAVGAAVVPVRRWMRARGLAAAAVTGLLAFALHLGVDFDLKIPALAMIVATVAALVTAEAWPVADPASAATPLLRALLAVTGAAVFVTTVVWVVPKYRAEEARREAREQIDSLARSGADVSRLAGDLARIRGRLAQSVALDPSNAQAWSDSAYADSLWALAHPAQTEEMGAAAVADSGRAVAQCPVVADFWIRRGVGFDMEHHWIEAGACFVRALSLAPGRPDCWFYQAYHLSADPKELAVALAAVEYALRLDPDYALAQSLRQRLTERMQHPLPTLPR